MGSLQGVLNMKFNLFILLIIFSALAVQPSRAGPKPAIDEDFWKMNKDLLEEFKAIQERMMEMFNDQQSYRSKSSRFSAQTDTSGITKVYQEDEGDRLLVHIKIPDLKNSQVTLKVIDNHIQVQGKTSQIEKRTEDQGTVVTESQFVSSFHHTIPLPFAVDPGKVDYQYKDDEIVVVIPK